MKKIAKLMVYTLALGAIMLPLGRIAQAGNVRMIPDANFDSTVNQELIIPHEDLLSLLVGGDGEAVLSEVFASPHMNGAVTSRDGSITFQPKENFVGLAVISYGIQDDRGMVRGRILIRIRDTN